MGSYKLINKKTYTFRMMAKDLTGWWRSACFSCIFSLCTFLLFAQAKPTEKHVDLTLKSEPEDLRVFNQWVSWNDPGSLLIHYINGQAAQFFESRDHVIKDLKTKNEWISRQKQVKNLLQKLIGPFPEKSALNPKITGILQKDGYRIEKIIYESRPDFYVSGYLFIPDQIEGRIPCILNLIGHEQESFRAELDQLVMINLVKKGMIVMTIDPPGQGENVQYFDPKTGVSSIGYSVIEHSYFGNQCFLTGTSSASFFIWDAIRALDYLVSREEVDTERIGVTGFSGGGTITAYLAAMDERIKVAIPSSWSTASRRQLETKGAQDAEAEIYLSLANGITFEDLIEVRAPKPTLMTFVSRDQYLSLQSARDAYAEAKSIYEAYDKPENLKLVEDDSRHWLTPKIRTAIYTFFQLHFNMIVDSTEQEINRLTDDELKVTTTGQLSSELKGKMIFDIHQDYARGLISKIEVSRKTIDPHLSHVLKKAKEIAGFDSENNVQPTLFINGRYQRDGYSVAKYAVLGDNGYPIPFLLFCPNTPLGKRPALIYLHPEGKAQDAEVGGIIESLVKSGYIVAAIDPLGVGETKNVATRNLAPGYTGLLIGRSVIGIQASDIQKITTHLKRLQEVDSNKISAVAFDGMCLPLLHCAAFNESIKNTLLIRPLISYRSVVMNRFYKMGLTENEGGGTGHPYEIDFNWGIAGVLTTYDLPDLVACVAPRRLTIIDAQDQNLENATVPLLDKELSFARKVYTTKGTPANFQMITGDQSIESLLKEILNPNRAIDF